MVHRRHRALLALTALAGLALPVAGQSPSFIVDNDALHPGGNYRNLPVLGDIDGDGDLDLVTSRDYSGNHIFINDGHGHFTDEQVKRLKYVAQQATYCVGLADFDGDGDLDLFNTNDHSFRESLFLNNGKGYFTDVSATHVPMTNGDTTGHAIADFDGDGDVDVVVFSSSRGGQDQLLVNNGRGVLSLGGNLPRTRAWSGLARDLDGDGDQDLLTLDYYHRTLMGVLVNNGRGTFQAITVAAFPGGTAGPFLLEDFNGDGRVDLFAVAARKLLLGQGGTTWQDVSTTNLPAYTAIFTGNHMVATDVDLDGDLDIVKNGLLLLNDGKGRFADASYRVSAHIGATLAGDLDGDLDPDLLMVNSANTTVVRNLRQHLRSDESPRIGKGYVLDIHHRSGAGQGAVSAWPFLSTRPGRVNVPGLGTFGLDPMLLFPLPMVAFQSGSLGRITLAIPQQPALIGVTLGVQCLLVDSAMNVDLTNCPTEKIR